MIKQDNSLSQANSSSTIIDDDDEIVDPEPLEELLQELDQHKKNHEVENMTIAELYSKIAFNMAHRGNPLEALEYALKSNDLIKRIKG